jgi:DNA recombination protein RmuC
VGDRLRQAQDSFNDARDKLSKNKGNVIRQAEMLRSLGVKPTKALPAPLIEASNDRELDLEESEGTLT